MDAKSADPVMERVAVIFEESGKTIEELGEGMGYAPGRFARQSAFQFLKKTKDPRLSMLRRFAKALDVSLEELIKDEK
jgi:transcriptional regulator with XRE-family HTH domain